MKTENLIESPDQIKQVAQKQIEKQLRFIGDMTIHKGQRCYEYNTLTKQLYIAKIETVFNPFATGVKIDIYEGKREGESKYENKVVQSPDCLYVVAINKKNALRKLNR